MGATDYVVTLKFCITALNYDDRIITRKSKNHWYFTRELRPINRLEKLQSVRFHQLRPPNSDCSLKTDECFIILCIDHYFIILCNLVQHVQVYYQKILFFSDLNYITITNNNLN